MTLRAFPENAVVVAAHALVLVEKHWLLLPERTLTAVIVDSLRLLLPTEATTQTRTVPLAAAAASGDCSWSHLPSQWRTLWLLNVSVGRDSTRRRT
jgi:hypothetical protein